MTENRMPKFMKKRYSKPVGKEVPSRRKLAIEAHKLKVEVEQRRHEMRCQKEDLEAARKARWQWQGREETMLEENERLRRQMGEMLPEMQFVTVRSRVINREDVMRLVHVNHGEVPVGVVVHWPAFQRRDLGDTANQAFVQAMADQIVQKVKKQVLEQFVLLR